MVSVKSILAVSLPLALVALTACGALSHGTNDARAEATGTTTLTPATLTYAPRTNGITTPSAASAATNTLTHAALTYAPSSKDRDHATKDKVATLTTRRAAHRAKTALEDAAPFFNERRTWKIDGHVFPGISTLNEHEADAFNGSYIMSQASLVTPWERCDAPTETARDIPVEEWFASYDARELDSDDRAIFQTAENKVVRVHDITCKDGTLEEIVELTPTRLAIAKDGAIFTATRTR